VPGAEAHDPAQLDVETIGVIAWASRLIDLPDPPENAVEVGFYGLSETRQHRRNNAEKDG